MDKNGMMGELLEKSQNSVSAALQVTASDISSSVQGQIGIQNEPTSSLGQNHYEATQQDRERTREVVSEFYAPDDSVDAGTMSDEKAAQQLVKDREELKKLIAKAHGETYYEPLVRAISTPDKQSAEEGAQEARGGPQIKEASHELPPLEEPAARAKRGQPLWVRRKMTKTERVGVSGE